MIKIKGKSSKDNIEKLIDIEIISIKNQQSISQSLNRQILIFLKNFVGNLELEISTQKENEVYSYINNANINLKKIKFNFAQLNELLESLNSMKKISQELTLKEFKDLINNYNKLYSSNMNKVFVNTTSIENFIHSISFLDFSEFINLDDSEELDNNYPEKIEEIVENIKTEIETKNENVTYQLELDENTLNLESAVSNANKITDERVLDNPNDLQDINILDEKEISNEKTNTKKETLKKANNRKRKRKKSKLKDINIIKDKTEGKEEENNIDISFQNSNNLENKLLNNKDFSDTLTEYENVAECKEISKIQIIENTLIISEMKQKVILPYTKQELEIILNENSEDFENIEDVIEKKYTVPFSYYKFTPFARFKEAYKLVADRDGGSKKSAISLALELFGNYNLHPAIITACKTLNELDIYLSCLEFDELEDFHFFKIDYQFAPAIVTEKFKGIFNFNLKKEESKV